MKYIISETQFSNFIKRRISPNDLDNLMNYVRLLINKGYDHDDLVYDAVRDFLNDKKLSDIDYHGDDNSYWNSYLKFESPLVAYVKHKLSSIK
jgi:hypothetical protein